MKLSKGTIIRTIMIGLVVLNLVLKQFGVDVINVEESTITSAVETVISVGAILSAWWYNNSFTETAKKADEFFKELQTEEPTEE